MKKLRAKYRYSKLFRIIESGVNKTDNWKIACIASSLKVCSKRVPHKYRKDIESVLQAIDKNDLQTVLTNIQVYLLPLAEKSREVSLCLENILLYLGKLNGNHKEEMSPGLGHFYYLALFITLNVSVGLMFAFKVFNVGMFLNNLPLGIIGFAIFLLLNVFSLLKFFKGQIKDRKVIYYPPVSNGYYKHLSKELTDTILSESYANQPTNSVESTFAKAKLESRLL